MYLTIKQIWYTQISTAEANYNIGPLHPYHGIKRHQVGQSIFCINTAFYHYYSLYINHNNFIGFQYLSFRSVYFIYYFVKFCNIAILV